MILYAVIAAIIIGLFLAMSNFLHGMINRVLIFMSLSFFFFYLYKIGAHEVFIDLLN